MVMMKQQDSILVHIPLNVTADMGVVMELAKAKRQKKLREWKKKQKKKKKRLLQSQDDDDDDNNGKTSNDGDADDVTAKNVQSKHDDESNKSSTDDDDGDVEGDGSIIHEKQSTSKKPPSTVPQRDQFSGVLDYLEAKYVRGVMVDDLDERVQRKRAEKRKKRQMEKQMRKKKKTGMGGKGLGGGGGGENDGINKGNDIDGQDQDGDNVGDGEDKDDDDGEEDLDDDEDVSLESSDSGAGSAYSDDSFLDDSLLRTSVAEQVQASSAFGGATKVEAEARAKAKAKKLNKSGAPLGIMLEYNDDDAFFVNVGDLEMADGYNSEDHEIDATSIDAMAKQDALAKGKSKGSLKKNKAGKNMKKLPTKSSAAAAAAAASSSTVATGKTEDGVGTTTAVNKQDQDDDNKPISSLSSLQHGKSIDSSQKTAEPDRTVSSPSPLVSGLHRPSPHEPSLTPEEEKIVEELKETSAQLYAEQKRLYAKVVGEIQAMTEEHLPRKSSAGGSGGAGGEMIRVSIRIPSNKKAGDMIMFSNPRRPGQKLRVSIPESGKPGGKFMVSVPAPDLRSSYAEENNFTREARDALEEYSRAFDEYIDAEAKVKEHFPEGKYYKPNNEKMKKFDELVDEFPEHLACPVDAAYLRKVVRRTRQNLQKRMKNAAANAAASGSLFNSASSAAAAAASAAAQRQQQLSSKVEEGGSNATGGGGGEDEVGPSTVTGSKMASNAAKDAGDINQETDKSMRPKKTLTLSVPEKSRNFPKIPFKPFDFSRGTHPAVRPGGGGGSNA